jgi:ketosteroid isomerase-like protein
MKRFLLSIAILLVVGVPVRAQDVEQAAAKKKRASSGELFETIARADAAVFEAFNAHDIERLMAMFTDDLEFYDDGDGLNDYAKTKADFVKLFAGTPDIRRELLKETLEVYPLKGYGAIEVGEHRFCHEEKGDGARAARMDCGVMKFSMVWRQAGEKWKLARVLSYAH